MAAISERATGRGEVRYHVKVRLKGHPLQAATFKRKRDAERWAKQTEAAILERRFFKATESARHTAAELLDRYFREVLPAKWSARSQRAQLFWWQRELGDLALSELTPTLIAACRDRLRVANQRAWRSELACRALAGV